MDLVGFLNTYFIDPIRFGTGYNIVNTAVYAILFVWLVDSTQKTIHLLKIDMKRFSNAFLPYIILGGVMRSLTDAQIYPQSFVFVTPGIYLLMLALSFIDAYFRTPLGWLLLAVNLSAVVVRNNAYLMVLGFAAVATIISLFLLKLSRFRLDLLSMSALAAHMLDAASTFVAIDLFHYGEQHVLANYFINLTHTAAVMFPIKFLAILLLIKIFDDIKDPNTRRFFYLMVIAIGAGPGIRNTLTVTQGL